MLIKMNPNSGNKLSSREKTELEKYVRFLMYKMSQIVVQSRFGEKRKVFTSSKTSFHDWFNLAIEDNPDIQVKAKEAYSNVIPLKNFCISTEILLKTADGDTLVLETWSLSLSTSDFFCDSPFVSYTSLASVYCRMTLLLKSVIAVTRITPAYKLSSRQSADTYVILFRIYPGEPQVHHLGKHYQVNKIGEVLTPVGTIKVSVCYRSKDDMTITPQHVEKGSPFMVKSDYFKPDMNPKCASGGIRIDKNLNCQKSKNDLKKVGAFAPSNILPDANLCLELAMLEKPFLNQARSKLRQPEANSKNEDSTNSDKNANLNVVNYAKVPSAVDYNCNASGNANDKHGKVITNDDDSSSGEFVMKPPFAGCDGDNDLGAFFRDCQTAPPLASFASQPSLQEQVSDITNQLANFELHMNDYDNFVDSICHIESEK